MKDTAKRQKFHKETNSTLCAKRTLYKPKFYTLLTFPY